jgi:hypothetical protein
MLKIMLVLIRFPNPFLNTNIAKKISGKMQ